MPLEATERRISGIIRRAMHEGDVNIEEDDLSLGALQ